MRRNYIQNRLEEVFGLSLHIVALHNASLELEVRRS